MLPYRNDELLPPNTIDTIYEYNNIAPIESTYLLCMLLPSAVKMSILCMFPASLLLVIACDGFLITRYRFIDSIMKYRARSQFLKVPEWYSIAVSALPSMYTIFFVLCNIIAYTTKIMPRWAIIYADTTYLCILYINFPHLQPFYRRTCGVNEF